MNAHALAMLALLGGCDVFGGGGGGDDEPPTDGGPTGLTLAWKSNPEEIPTPDSRVTRATFQLSSLRVIGDAGPLVLGIRTIAWERETEPEAVTIPDAPSGMYSRCLFDLVAPSGAYAYEIEGVIEQNDMKLPFTIRDRDTAAISIDFSEALAPGGEARIETLVRVDELVSAVDFAQVPVQNGALLVDEGSSQLARVRQKLATAFVVDN